MKTSLLKKDLVENTEFFIEYKPEVPQELSSTKCIDFVLEPDKLKVKDVSTTSYLDMITFHLTKFEPASD